MKFLYDFFPILLFFLVYKLYTTLPPEVIGFLNHLPLLSLTPSEAGHAIYLATAVAIVGSFLQVLLYWLKTRRLERMHVISLVLFIVFGGATLLLRDPTFIKWKPTLLNWLFAAVFLGSQFIGRKPLVERMMAHAISVPETIWRRLNLGWVGFFVISGLANLIVAYRFSEQTWVNFKLFGLLGLTFAFVLAQAVYLARFIQADHDQGRV